jgi:hypothetical protein
MNILLLNTRVPMYARPSRIKATVDRNFSTRCIAYQMPAPADTQSFDVSILFIFSHRISQHQREHAADIQGSFQ